MRSQQTEQSSWQKAVRVIKPDQFDSNTPQTAGMQRLSAVSKQVADTRGIWAGVTDVQAHVGTGKHHHGDQEWADPCRPAIEQYFVLIAERLQATDAGADNDADAFGGFFGYVQSGVVHGFH